MQTSRKVTVAALAAFAAAATTLAGGAAAAPVATGTTVKVKETDFKIALSRAVVPAGKVTFVTGNHGKILHELVILKTSRSAGTLGTGARIKETGQVAETGDLRTGAIDSLTVKLAPGHYALVCNLPGHYAAGMYTNFIVK